MNVVRGDLAFEHSENLVRRRKVDDIMNQQQIQLGSR